MPLMAVAGPPSLPLPSNSPSVPTRNPPPPPLEFTYDRSIPSIRWPSLNLDEQTPISPLPAPPPIPISRQNPDETLDPLEDRELETLDSKNSRTRTKKMTKLALKRAKDWRQRVSLLTDKILSLPPSAAVADVLDARAVQMTPSDYSFVVKSVGKSNWQRSLEVFEWLTLRRRYSPFPRLLAAIISVLGRARQDSLAEEVFLRSSDDADPSVQVYNAIMGVFARTGNFSRVQELLGFMKSKGVEPDLVSFNTLINARAKAGQMPPGSAKEMLDEVWRSGLRPDAITYNTLISACSRSSNLEDAIGIFRRMEESGCSPDLWTYNAMLSVYGRSGSVREAERLFLELGKMGFLPDAVTYNSILYAYAKNGDVIKVKRVCDEMVGAGFKMDEITYNTIIHMYGKRGDLDLALELYSEMKVAGRSPDAVTYTVLIDSLGKSDRISEAGKVMKEMVEAHVRPTLRVFSALICGYGKAGMRVEAERTFDLMVRSGIKPDLLAYSVVLDILLRFDETRKAMILYQSMMRDGFRPDAGLYAVLIRVLVKEEKDEEVHWVVKDMEEVCGLSPQSISSILIKGECFCTAAELLKKAVAQGCEVDSADLVAILNGMSTLNKQEEAFSLLNFIRENSPNSNLLVTEISIAMLCKAGQIEAAMEEYNKTKSWGFAPLSCTLYESLITYCEQRNFYSDASQLFSDMKFLGLEPCQSIYRSMITTYCKMGYPETAQHLVEAAQRANVSFNDHAVYVSLIETYGRLNLWQRAESFVGKLRLSSSIDRKVWNALIYAYAESGRYEQARAVFNMMMKNGPPPSVDSVNGLMKALIIDGRLEELYVVVEELQDMDFKISKSTILMMLDAFARNGNIFEVKKIYHGMKAAGYLPTIHLYRSMIGLFSRAKRVRDVELMVSEMEGAGFKPDLIIFNSLLKMYTTIEDFKSALKVYQSIQESGFEADEDTYNSLIVMYSRDLRPEEGFTLLGEMRKKGLEPKLDTYKSLLSSCGREKLCEQAEELFICLRTKGYRLDRSFYHIMMKLYRNAGNNSKAENLLLMMKNDGIEPTIATMHMLMVSYGDAGQPQEAENVLKNLKTSTMDLSTLPYSSVIDAYLKNGDYNMGIMKMLEMKRDGVEPDHRIWTCIIRAASLCSETCDAINLLNSLRDTGFDLPIRLLTEKPESLITEVEKLLGELGPKEDNASFNFVNALEDFLWAFERRATASWVFQLAIRQGIYRHDIFRVVEKNWGADFRKLSAGAALVGLTLWLDHMQDASLQGSPESQKSVALITGTAEYNMVSLNSTLKAFLWEMGSPFLPCRTRSGVLVAKSHSLRMWLKDSSFCMDLELKDAPALPKSNSMKLIEGYFMRAALVPAFKDINERLGQVRPKKFARLALLSTESRDKVIKADIEGRKEKLEKWKKKGVVRARKPTKFRRMKFMRRQHKSHAT